MNSPTCIRRRRGSVMIVVVLVACIVVISLTSYLHLSLNSLNLAERSFHANGAMNLAEIGVEEALHCYNLLPSVSTPADAWTGWTLSGITARRTFTGFSQGPNSTGTVKVYCENFDPPSGVNPVVVTQSTVTLPRGRPIMKTIVVEIQRRSLYPGGLITRKKLALKGNNVVDSWIADPDGDPATPFVPYSAGVAGKNTFIASASTNGGDLDIDGNGIYIWGSAASGGGSVNTGGQTTLQNASSPALPKVDPNLLTYDFAATFPEVEMPNPTIVNVISADIKLTVNFPRAGDLADTDGRYYYRFDQDRKISMSSNNNVLIDGAVTFIFNNHHTKMTIELLSNEGMTVNAGADLEIYTGGHMRFKSNTTVNATREPSACRIWGIEPKIGEQTFELDSNVLIQAAIYAPNAKIKVDSNGRINGSLVASEIQFLTNTYFSYDESLGVAGAGQPYGVVSWREMRTAAERATYATELSF